MAIKEELTNALKDAMKSKDTIKKNTIRMILSSIKNKEIDTGEPLNDSEVIQVLQKQLKMRNDTLTEAKAIDRQDIIDQNNAEIEIIKGFMPESMDPEQLKSIIKQIIDDVGAESMRDMGKVMQQAIPNVKGKASNAEISQVVRELLG